ncbi:MAG: carboxymuconolactone decarboxylase family protein [Candidatus Binatia bacterium]
MPIVNPLPADKAHEELRELYDSVTKRVGFMPNLYATMARCPSALKNYYALVRGLTAEGSVEPRLKELAYLKASLVNGCEY